ncbi:MAG: transporter [Pseudomonadales bacterium]
MIIKRHKQLKRWLAVYLAAALCPPATAQDLEPRRWTPLPLATKVIGMGYGYTTGDLFFDPVLQVEDAQLDLDTLALSYVQSFAVLGKPVRFDLLLPWQTARWDGRLAGQPTSVERVGLADPWLRLSTNLIGDPALRGGEFAAKMAAQPVRTVVGAALSVTVPVGEYLDEKLLNLGQNRYIIRPQIGVLHSRGPWSFEFTGSIFFYTDNNDFFGGVTREQDPLYALQTHVVRVFKPGLWASFGAGYGWGGRSKINGEDKDDERGDVLLALSLGVPLSRAQGLKFAYVRGEAGSDVGADTDTLTLAWSMRF